MKLQISEMTTLKQLEEASEYERYDLRDLIARAEEINLTPQQLDQFVALCNSYENTQYTWGSWSKSQPTVKF